MNSKFPRRLCMLVVMILLAVYAQVATPVDDAGRKAILAMQG